MRVIAFRSGFLKLAACGILLAPALVSCGGGSHGAAPGAVPYVLHQATPAQQMSVNRAVEAEASATQAYFEFTGGATEFTCNVFPLICVAQGSSASMGIKVTCTRNGHVINCGSVSWTVKTSHAGLTASFKPNPGNPTKETVHAAKTVPVGTHYTQTITTKCSLVANCPKGTFPIHVLK